MPCYTQGRGRTRWGSVWGVLPTSLFKVLLFLFFDPSDDEYEL